MEDNLENPITLGEIAEASGLSTYYFSRLFNIFAGESPMSYLRHRRLTEAALRLENTPGYSLINLALDYGFESQEAFTRAFKRNFGIPPGKYRKERLSLHTKFRLRLTSSQLSLRQGAPKMIPEFATRQAFHVIGLTGDFSKDTADTSKDTTNTIVDLWRNLNARYDEFDPATIDRDYNYGVCLRGDGNNFTYLAAIAANSLKKVPKGMTGLKVEAGNYAVFHLTIDKATPINQQFNDAYQGIWGDWLPNSEYDFAETPDFELYGPGFDGKTGTGEIEIWIPVKKK